MTGFLTRYARFVTFLAVGGLATLALLTVTTPPRALLGGFDIGVATFLGLTAHLFGKATEASMRRRAADNEPDQHILSLLGLVVVVVVLTALGVELGGGGGHEVIALAGGTLLAAWLFANLLFTFHYAHAWYVAGADDKDREGLDFPGDDTTPDYWDFAYFAFVLGMTFQVSDVEVTSQRMRRVALLHGLLAFLFNIVVVALTVSLVGDALKK